VAPITNFRMPTPTSLDANSFFTTPANDILNQAPNQKLRE
jgi:hypothetical protein